MKKAIVILSLLVLCFSLFADIVIACTISPKPVRKPGGFPKKDAWLEYYKYATSNRKITIGVVYCMHREGRRGSSAHNVWAVIKSAGYIMFAARSKLQFKKRGRWHDAWRSGFFGQLAAPVKGAMGINTGDDKLCGYRPRLFFKAGTNLRMISTFDIMRPNGTMIRKNVWVARYFTVPR
ncbi:MAG: hypothetical protein C4562_02685 [Actinobacteria bacterium]|nr:MAG: hypothetical protein C4562_02685 [Actinomycetota bacterium]